MSGVGRLLLCLEQWSRNPVLHTTGRIRGRGLGRLVACSVRANTTGRRTEYQWRKPAGFDTGLLVYNSLSKRKEPLILAREGTATWYSCGPTVYDHAHLGHACSYVRFDILQRILKNIFGINIIHAMVITDIDDKIIKRASEDFLQTFSANEFRMFCLLTKYRSAVDYSEASMNGAKSLLSSISSFFNDANAYIKGQLLCQDVDESFLWERLSQAKVNVQLALADDFDTPRAIDAIMGLIHHGNRQLQAVTKLTSGESINGNLHSVVEQLVNFRRNVRNYALATDVCETTSREDRSQLKEQRRRLLQEREPLLKACDVLRQDMASLGIVVKVGYEIFTLYLSECLITRRNGEHLQILGVHVLRICLHTSIASG
ncbi:SYCM protein, partial [Polypterus senegalus]